MRYNTDNTDSKWEELKSRLENRVERMKYDPAFERRSAYQDVLLVMGDIEDSED